MRFQAPRGTQDVLPSEAHKWQFVERTFADVVRRYGYKEIRTPSFEDTELFTRSSGETSDIVSKQMYSFVDKGDRPITFKPEGTAPAIRAVIENSLAPTGTVQRLYYITPIFRYERPQKGRLRESHQVGLELIGSSSPAADAEVIEITVEFYRAIGLKDIRVLLNSLGREECRKRFREAILEKAKPFIASQEPEDQAKILKNPLRLLDSKNPEVLAMVATIPPVLDFLEEDSKARFSELQRLLDDADLPYTVDPGIVRGLDYYTETVFEVQSTSLGAQSSLCGGGRYDDLIKELGGPPTPAVGVAMGIERALIVMEADGAEVTEPAMDVFIVSADEPFLDEVAKLARELRAAGVAVLTDLDGKSMKSQLRQADRSDARYAVLIGEEEMAKGFITLRELATGQQKAIERTTLLQILRG